MKRTLLACSLALFSNMTLANWVGELSYSNLSDDESDVDISMSAIGGTVGYRYQVNDNFYLTPEVRLGAGVSGDELYGVDISIKNYYGAGIRSEYHANDAFYVLASAAILTFKFDAEYRGYSVTEDESEFGVGVGAGFNLNETAAIEATYETYDGTDLLKLGVRFNF